MEMKVNRRGFLKAASVAATGFTIMKSKTVFGTEANSAVNIGIIGCGNRGSFVASSFMENTGTRIVALADLFEDRLLEGKKRFNELSAKKGYPSLQDSHIFRGSKAYKKLLDLKDVDAVLVSTPGFYHPEHLEASVEAGKHTYSEKPVGTDVFGCRRVKRAGSIAEGRVSLAIGFQIRHATPFVEMIKRIHNGALGDIVFGEVYYFAGAIALPDYPGVSPDELRLRRWYFDSILSGDIIVDQGLHVVDICNWVFGTHPLRATGSGGRKGRKDEGNCWSHFIVDFEYPGNVHVAFQSAQYDPGYGDVCERFFGTRGISESHYTGGVFIRGEQEWDSGVQRSSGEKISKEAWDKGAFKSALDDADPNKQKAFIDSIKTGKLINEASQGAESTLSAILGRTAAYSGEMVTWDEIIASDEKRDPMIDLAQFDR